MTDHQDEKKKTHLELNTMSIKGFLMLTGLNNKQGLHSRGLKQPHHII